MRVHYVQLTLNAIVRDASYLPATRTLSYEEVTIRQKFTLTIVVSRARNQHQLQHRHPKFLVPAKFPRPVLKPTRLLAPAHLIAAVA